MLPLGFIKASLQTDRGSDRLDIGWSRGVNLWYHPHDSHERQLLRCQSGLMYNASAKLYTESGRAVNDDSFTLGIRVLLTCDVTGLPEESEVISYKWYHNCTQVRCEIEDGTPYYRATAVDDCTASE